MGYKADSGQKFDQGRINRVLALVNELTNSELAQVIAQLKKVHRDRQAASGDKDETIQV